MSKHRIVAAVVAALVAGVAQVASAADLEVLHKGPPAYTPAFSWTRCYVGAHAGVAAMQDSFTGEGRAAQSPWGAGVLLGAQIGCDYQLGRFVVGLESEAWGAFLRTENNFAFDNGLAGKASTTNPWNFAIAARAGIVVDPFLIYMKGGVVWGSFRYNFSDTDGFAQSGSAINTGFLWGLGFEYMLSRDWTLKVESDVILFTANNVNLASTDGGFRQTQSATVFIFKIGGNYRFDFD
jgi:outer membrane immunogenic protein